METEGREMLEGNSIIWEIAKVILSLVIIPFSVWLVKSNGDRKDENAKLKQELLEFKADVSKEYAPKTEVSAIANQIDAKLTNMQNAVTQRIDTMQSNIATMIAGIGRDGK